jgi:hypothetical protein
VPSMKHTTNASTRKNGRPFEGLEATGSTPFD